jgi:hypothetical protein
LYVPLKREKDEIGDGEGEERGERVKREEGEGSGEREGI